MQYRFVAQHCQPAAWEENKQDHRKAGNHPQNVSADGENCRPWPHEYPHRYSTVARSLDHQNMQGTAGLGLVHRHLGKGVGHAWLVTVKAMRDRDMP